MSKWTRTEKAFNFISSGRVEFKMSLSTRVQLSGTALAQPGGRLGFDAQPWKKKVYSANEKWYYCTATYTDRPKSQQRHRATETSLSLFHNPHPSFCLLPSVKDQTQDLVRATVELRSQPWNPYILITEKNLVVFTKTEHMCCIPRHVPNRKEAHMYSWQHKSSDWCSQ